MAGSCSARRRRSYAPRRHDAESRPVDFRSETRLQEAPADKWWRVLTDDLDHAFSTAGTGYQRSRCGKARWTAACQPWTFAEPSNPCADCELLVNGTEAEKREAFGG